MMPMTRIRSQMVPSASLFSCSDYPAAETGATQRAKPQQNSEPALVPKKEKHTHVFTEPTCSLRPGHILSLETAFLQETFALGPFLHSFLLEFSVPRRNWGRVGQWQERGRERKMKRNPKQRELPANLPSLSQSVFQEKKSPFCANAVCPPRLTVTVNSGCR